MENTPNNAKDFSVSEGGPAYNAMVKMGVYNKQGKLAIVGLCITWVPLVIITAIEGTLFSATGLSFLGDIAMQARILVALPLLILIKVAIDGKVIAVIKYISEALMSEAERQTTLNRIIYRVKKLTSSAITEIMLLIIVIVATIGFVNK